MPQKHPKTAIVHEEFDDLPLNLVSLAFPDGRFVKLGAPPKSSKMGCLCEEKLMVLGHQL